MAQTKRGRPAIGNDPMKAVALQATLLASAAGAGVLVDPGAIDRVATALAKFSAHDIQAIEILKGSPLALEAMARLAVENPDAFLRHYSNFLEFSKPKLARVEHKHEGANLGVFVAVEQREAGPPARLADKLVSEQ